MVEEGRHQLFERSKYCSADRHWNSRGRGPLRLFTSNLSLTTRLRPYALPGLSLLSLVGEGGGDLLRKAFRLAPVGELRGVAAEVEADVTLSSKSSSSSTPCLSTYAVFS